MGKTFSENWHRVSKVRACLRPTVSARLQNYRGEDWYVLHDPFTGNFFRLTPTYYDFLIRLDFTQTIEEAWLKALEENPEHGPGQEDVISMLIELSKANLIYFEEEADTAKLFEQQDEKERKARRQKWMNILFIRFGLFNPDGMLSALMPLWKVLISVVGAIIWFLVVCCGVFVAFQYANEIGYGASSVLEPDNLIPLYAGLVLLKIVHETGHAAMCKRFGGHVTSVGIMFLFFAPLPYVDATSSWALNNKWQRMLVSAAGILVELFMGAVCCMVWAWSPPGLVHTIAFNMMCAATVSTLLFNANPLMRFDGYYILVDFLEVPNIYQRSRDHVFNLCKKYLFRVRGVKLAHRSQGEGFWMTAYGISSSVYRVFLVLGISMFLADNYFIVGLLVGAFMVASSIAKPLFGFIKFLVKSPSLRGVRTRALLLTTTGFGAVLLFVVMVPLPYDIIASGVLESREAHSVIVNSAGQVVDLCATPGKKVEKGQVLVLLSSPEIDFQIQKARTQLKQLAILKKQDISRMGLDRAPVEKRRQALVELIRQLGIRKQNLVIRAGRDGLWVLPDAETIRNQWLAKGHNLGRIISTDDFRFNAVIPQEDASSLFDGEIRAVSIRIKGQADTELKSTHWKLLPHYHEELPSAALGWMGGGDIPLASQASEGVRAAEPFYLLEVDTLVPDVVSVAEGRIGKAGIEMAPRSLAERLSLYVKQFLQKRYQL
ncbi:site-2 protease family protein [Halodesulfovibrio sp.]|jgi:putative peptide zinc metalloprotease protein|uniref:site-2 protease family protein n=1 Tax=Halodesulfovibrio sp. TaxID=1912772 RepID=UPI0025F0D040|nr:site-2 protease family protein [Halodesulfovibrio sp.]MCT4627429.1 hypothetical protein [Halodesulfovibrio sp.]